MSASAHLNFSTLGLAYSIETMEYAMNTDLKNFVVAYLRVVVMALVPMVLTAFLSIPYSLGGNPGDPYARAQSSDQHMT